MRTSVQTAPAGIAASSAPKLLPSTREMREEKVRLRPVADWMLVKVEGRQ
jgi:hypothetical protein